MTYRSSPRKKIPTRRLLTSSLAAALSASLVTLPSTPIRAQEQPTIWQKIRRIFQPPRRIGSGSNQESASVQDRCPFIAEGEPRLTALLPANAQGVTDTEKTIALRPTFWFYVPYTAQQYRDVEFVLIDQQEDDVYRTRFPLTNAEPAILRLSLPTTVLLEREQRYRWVFSIICNPANRSGDATVNGWVERVSISRELSESLGSIPAASQEIADINARVLAYTEADIWYETLNTLATTYQAAPNDADQQMNWQTFLAAIDLETLINAPVIDCCLTDLGEPTNLPTTPTPLEE